MEPAETITNGTIAATIESRLRQPSRGGKVAAARMISMRVGTVQPRAISSPSRLRLRALHQLEQHLGIGHAVGQRLDGAVVADDLGKLAQAATTATTRTG